jgi:O-antigen biosynthesis protein
MTLSLEALAQWGRRELPRVLFITHGWGGGVERHVRDLAELLHDRAEVFILRATQGGVLELDFSAADGVTRLSCTVGGASTVRMPLWTDALRALQFDRVHLHHVHGWSDGLLELVKALKIPIDVTLHDYFAACPQYQLVNELGRYCGEPDTKGCDTCLQVRPPQWVGNITTWRTRFEQFLLAADRVIAPSSDVATRIARYFPRITVLTWAHPEREIDIPRVVKVGILGGLSKSKGLDVVFDTAKVAQGEYPQLSFRVIGHSAEPLPAGITATGTYDERALPRLLAEERVDVLWFPSQVPETFSFTLSAAIATGLPVVATNLGAFVERLAGRSRVRLLPHDASASQWIESLCAVATDDHLSAYSVSKPNSGTTEHYREQYLAGWSTTRSTVRADTKLLVQLVKDSPSPPLGKDHAIIDLFRVGAFGGHRDSVLETERRLAQLPAGEFGVVGRSQFDEKVSELNALSVQLDASFDEVNQLKAQVDELFDKMSAQAATAAQQIGELQTQGANARAHIAHVESERDAMFAERNRIITSMSWRITRPLRGVRKVTNRAITTTRHFARLALNSPNLVARVSRLFHRGGVRALWSRSKLEMQRATATSAVPAASVGVAFDATIADATITALSVPSSVSPRISIVIPVYGQHQTTFACLKSIAVHKPRDAFEVIVMDDASPEPAALALQAVEGITIVRNATNLGFIGNVNAGIENAHGEFVLMLNNDTVLTAGAIDALIDTFAAHKNVGMVGAKLLNRDGSLQEAGGIIWRDGSGWNWGRNERADDPRFCFVRDADYCSGAALMIQRSLLLELGGFDTYYTPAYYEDTDLAFRIRARGLRVIYQPAAEIFHLEGVSHGRDEKSGVKAYQAINAKKFYDRWAATLVTHAENGIDPEREAHRLSAGSVLIVEACMITPDQDSGSVRMLNLISILKEANYHVVFVADNLEQGGLGATLLRQRGVETVHGAWAGSVQKCIERRGKTFDTIVFCRHYIASQYVASVRKHAPQARIVFDTVDLHFVREEREAQLLGNAAMHEGAQKTRNKELYVIRQSDVTLVVSEYEKTLLNKIEPNAQIEIVSNIHVPAPRGNGYEAREGLVFVGGFRHPPNVDAVKWYASEVLPLIKQSLPGVITKIIGSNMTDEIKALASDALEIVGYVDDTAPYLDRARLSIAPLRYGAGVKGKVNEAMNHGLPVIATGCAVEGMHVDEGVDVLTGDTAAEFAAAVIRAYNDPVLWATLSEGGRRNIANHFSIDAVRPNVLRAIVPKGTKPQS